MSIDDAFEGFYPVLMMRKKVGKGTEYCKAPQPKLIPFNIVDTLAETCLLLRKVFSEEFGSDFDVHTIILEKKLKSSSKSHRYLLLKEFLRNPDFSQVLQRLTANPALQRIVSKLITSQTAFDLILNSDTSFDIPAGLAKILLCSRLLRKKHRSLVRYILMS
jgi:hypothetical protein